MSESVKPAKQKFESHERVLSMSEIKQLLFMSFKFAQGSVELHKNLLNYCRNYYGKQNVTAYNSAELAFRESARKYIEKDSTPHLTTALPDDIYIKEYLAVIDSQLLSTDPLPVNLISAQKLVWLRDAKYILGYDYLEDSECEVGRPNKKLYKKNFFPTDSLI